jgi:hypothetical protein
MALPEAYERLQGTPAATAAMFPRRFKCTLADFRSTINIEKRPGADFAYKRRQNESRGRMVNISASFPVRGMNTITHKGPPKGENRCSRCLFQSPGDGDSELTTDPCGAAYQVGRVIFSARPLSFMPSINTSTSSGQRSVPLI